MVPPKSMSWSARLGRSLAPFALVVASLGCANHLGYREVARDELKVEVLEERVRIRTEAPIVRAPSFAIELQGERRVRERSERAFVRFEEYTPYEGWRELYEVPLGALGLSLSAALSALDVVLLDYVPDGLAGSTAVWSATALNPVLNLESRSRARQAEVEREIQSTGDTERVVAFAVGARELRLAYDSHRSAVRECDPAGRASVRVLEIAPAGLAVAPRRLRIAAWYDGEEADVVTVYVDRELAARLVEAVGLRDRVRDAATPPEFAAQAILRLERLGFALDSRELEDELYVEGMRTPDFLTRLRLELETELVAPPAAAAALAD